MNVSKIQTLKKKGMNLQFVVMDTMNAVPRAKSYGMICFRSFMTGFAQ